MTAIDRRTMLKGISYGAAAATVGLAITPKAAVSMPLMTGTTGAVNSEDLVEKAQVVIVPRRRRRRRRWVCWWRRGRRVCGWRYF